jgi:hypothetical protein
MKVDMIFLDNHGDSKLHLGVEVLPGDAYSWVFRELGF